MARPGHGPDWLHPFFQTSRDDPPGMVTFLSLGDDDADQATPPYSLLHAEDGYLFFLKGGNRIHCLHGHWGEYALTLARDNHLRALCKGSQGRVRYLGDVTAGSFDFNMVRPNRSQYPMKSCALDLRPGPPTLVVAGPQDDLIGFSGTHLFRLAFQADAIECGFRELDPAQVPAAAIWHPDSQMIVGTLPARGKLIRFSDPKRSGTEISFDLAGLEPHRIAPGPDGRVWFTLAGQNRVGALDPRTTDYTLYPLGSREDPPFGAQGIALGQDGNLWIALQTFKGFARVTPKGEVTLFPIPGLRIGGPVRLYGARDGRLLVTFDESPRIGAVTVVGMGPFLPGRTGPASDVGPRAGEPEETKEAVQKVPGVTRSASQRKRGKKKAAKARRFAAELGEGCTATPPLPVLEAPKEEKEVDPAPSPTDTPEGSEEFQPTQPEPAPDPDRTRVAVGTEPKSAPPTVAAEALSGTVAPPPEAFGGDVELKPGLYLIASTVRHIYQTHRYGDAHRGKSEFAACLSNPAELRRLVREAIQENWTLPMVHDAWGKRRFYHRLPAVGWYRNRNDQFVPTDHYVVTVVKRRDPRTGRYFQRVDSMFPCSPYH